MARMDTDNPLPSYTDAMGTRKLSVNLENVNIATNTLCDNVNTELGNFDIESSVDNTPDNG
nr:8974_t:CDS:2 [Entrophospora candida]CAG8504917.1 14224_t:CDS:2 [Entrophospora candida]